VSDAKNGQPASLLKGASEMDRLRLKQYLEAAGVPEDKYLLVGLDPPRTVREGACIVRPNQRSWEVLVWEPAGMAPSLTFLNEDQACGYALDVLAPAAQHRPFGAVTVNGANGVAEVYPPPASPSTNGAELAPATLTGVGGLATRGGKAPAQL
jgi:hypothetical protein